MKVDGLIGHLPVRKPFSGTGFRPMILYGRPATLPAHAVPEVGGLGPVDDADDLELDLPRQLLEEPPAAAEQHRNLMDLDLVEHTGLQCLAAGVAALYVDVPVAGGGLRLAHRADDAVGH